MARTKAGLKSSRAPLPKLVVKELKKHKLALKKEAVAKRKKERNKKKQRAAEAKQMAAVAKTQGEALLQNSYEFIGSIYCSGVLKEQRTCFG